MMPLLTNRKRSSGFTIESIMSSCGSAGTNGGDHTTCVCPVDSRPMSAAERTSTLASYHPASIGTHHPLFPGAALDSRVYCDSRLQLPGVDCGQAAAINANMRLFYNGLPQSMPPGAGALAAANAGGYPGGLPAHLLGTPPPKEQFPFYTWLLARHGNYLSNSMHGSENSYLFPFRKQKRIRTAFSPSQLLHLEKAFERNHYVVGQERKDLAAELSLTETQVKVWFQNRRTKYKRVQTEDEDSSTEQRSSDNETEDGNTSRMEIRDAARPEPSGPDRDSCSDSEYVDVDSPISNVNQVGLEGQVT